MDNKQYLGDGLYCSYDGYQYCLTAENGITATDTVYLEPEVLSAFMNYVKKAQQALSANKGEK